MSLFVKGNLLFEFAPEEKKKKQGNKQLYISHSWGQLITGKEKRNW